MAHYAFLDSNNIVIEVIVGRDETELIEGLDPETWYSNYKGLPCKRTSYNTFSGKHLNGGIPFRGNYASIGHVYDEKLDAFLPPKPFESWVLNEEIYNYEPPVPYPADEKSYRWNESIVNWELIETEDK